MYVSVAQVAFFYYYIIIFSYLYDYKLKIRD